MAQINEFSRLEMNVNSVHSFVECTYSVFTDENGDKYLQLDTYGSTTRKIRGKKSQSVQFNQHSIEKLVEIFKSEGLIE